MKDLLFFHPDVIVVRGQEGRESEDGDGAKVCTRPQCVWLLCLYFLCVFSEASTVFVAGSSP